MQKIRKGDEVVVIAGKDKGRRGTVQQVIKHPILGVQKLVIEGINMIKKHVKPNPNAGIEGGIIAREAAIDVSNAAIWNPMTKKADKIGFKTLEDGQKVRYFKSNKEIIDI